MTVTDRFANQLVNGLLAIQPLANLAKVKAKKTIVEQAEAIGVPWRERVKQLKSRETDEEFSPEWEKDYQNIVDRDLEYPAYYLTSFHAYDSGNLSWEAAMEAEVAAYAVHARIFDERNKEGDPRLRQSYHDLLAAKLNPTPQRIVDLGCSVGMSTFALQRTFPTAEIVGVDLSPYFLSVADYQSRQRELTRVRWRHAAAENTGLPAASYDLVSSFLMCHELPQSAIREIVREAYRLLVPGGNLTIMDMNPQSPVYASMKPYMLTLLKSTEPYLDEYFTFDISQELASAGFKNIEIISNTHRHRSIFATK
jgi:ubiquinone/menaquinone biosynthesis C-methylase UbiE